MINMDEAYKKVWEKINVDLAVESLKYDGIEEKWYFDPIPEAIASFPHKYFKSASAALNCFRWHVLNGKR